MTAEGSAYYNEHDPHAAEWLRRLVAAGLVAPGVVDERDIRDVTPDELSGFVQCHFFAGIGIWSGALRASGWPDDRGIWTASCPCQPFSTAGRGDGTADERHLWPHLLHLVEQRRPDALLGEQVASKDGLWWNDLVSADMERAGYAFASVNLCAAGFGLDWRGSAYASWLERAIHGCPDPMVARQLRNFAGWADQSLAVGGLHIRQRQYFVGLADADGEGSGAGLRDSGPGAVRVDDAPGHSGDDGLVDRERAGLEGQRGGPDAPDHAERAGEGEGRPAAPSGDAGGLSDAHGGDAGAEREQRSRKHGLRAEGGSHVRAGHSGVGGDDDPGSATGSPDGGRSPFDWLLCRDGSWRPVGPGTHPLAHAVAGRVGKLRAYGNGLDFETATEFCRTVREMIDGVEA